MNFLTWRFLLVLLMFESAHGQTLRSQLGESPADKSESAWSSSINYGVFTDLVDNRAPRAYRQSVGADLNYAFTPHWQTGAALSGSATTLNGQIDKGSQQSSTEVLNPSLNAEIDYENSFSQDNSYTLSLSGDPLLDEPSRLEGYRGIIAGGASVRFNFFGKLYSMSHCLNLSHLFNSYEFSAMGDINPDYFASYKMSHAVRLWKSNYLTYTFGLKTTRYLNGFIGYSYSNSVSLSHSWRWIHVALTYENGGFTDNGSVSLWYIDQTRRLVSLSTGINF